MSNKAVETSTIEYVSKKFYTYDQGIQTAIANLQSQISGLVPNTSEAGIIAAGTTQANATSITKSNTRFDTVAASKTARIDIAPVVNAKAVIQNWGANDLTVYASTVAVGATFNVDGTPQANTAGLVISPGNQLVVYCYVAGEWSTQ